MTTNLTIKQALSLPLETLQAMPIEELQSLHSVLKESTQKQATRKADLVSGIIKGLKKASQVVAEVTSPQPELVENSVKAPSKKKPSKKKKEAEAETVAEEPKKPAKKQPKKQEEKVEEEAPKKPKSLKRKAEKKADVTKMSQEELIEYAKTLQAEVEQFPEVISGEKSSYELIEFDTIKDMQVHLLANPMKLYVFADEKIDDELTQFLVLFVNQDIIVLLDRNRQKDTTITLKQEQVDAEHITMNKTKFKYAFYNRK